MIKVVVHFSVVIECTGLVECLLDHYLIGTIHRQLALVDKVGYTILIQVVAQSSAIFNRHVMGVEHGRLHLHIAEVPLNQVVLSEVH